MAPPGEAVSTVRLVNCRHGFGEALRFDAIVDGAYPDRQYILWLSQPAEIYKGIKLAAPCAYVAIPRPEHAAEVIRAITPYNLCDVFRKGEPITVHVCGENVSSVSWQLTV